MIVAISSQKGGVGKTTTAAALGAELWRNGCRVLLVDLDPQGNLSFYRAADETAAGVMDVLTRAATAAEAIQIFGDGPDIIRGGIESATAETALNLPGKEYRLREALAPVKSSYDFIILDCPPALGTLTINALTAADYAILPAQADAFSLRGLAQLRETFEAVKAYTNPGLQIAGILLTRYTARACISKEMRKLLTQAAAAFNTSVYRTAIRETVVVKEAQAAQTALYYYAPRSKACADYTAFAAEFLKNTAGRWSK